jgi:hypothetical protein
VLLGSLLALILACIALFVVIPTILPKGFDPYPSTSMIAPLGLLAGFGIALPFACLWANRGQRRAMLRFKWGRAISAVIAAFFLPIGLWGPMPVVVGFGCFLLLSEVQNAQTFMQAILSFLIPQAVIIGASLIVYPLACGMIYGLKMRFRLPAFAGLIFGAIALLLLMGFRTSGQL